jgi:hypothetical protein
MDVSNTYYRARQPGHWVVICTTREWTESEWHEFATGAEAIVFMEEKADEMLDREFTVVPPMITDPIARPV